MASIFGLNGYLCEMTPVKGGYLLAAWDDKLPVDVRVEKEIKNSDLEDGIRPDDRAQVERLFAPLFDELDVKREKRTAKIREEDLKAENETRAAAAESAKGLREAQAKAQSGSVQKDGTAVNMNIGENPGSDKKVSPKTNTEHTVAKGDSAEAKATHPAPGVGGADQQAEITKDNAARVPKAT